MSTTKTVVNAQLQNVSILNIFCYTMANGGYLNTYYLPVRFKRYLGHTCRFSLGLHFQVQPQGK